MKKLLLVLLACLTFMSAAFAGQLNLNTASQDELDTLKGIGPVKAKAIVDYRAKNGPFKSVDELDKVPGFGQKTVDNLRDQLTVGAAAALAESEGKARKKAGSAKPDGKAPAGSLPARPDEKAAKIGAAK